MTVQTAILPRDAVRREAGEVLYSRTDSDGVIRAVNAAFAQVAGYEIGELVGMPHRVVRHSETPRALFHLMWGRLKAGEPAAVYLRNRTKSGDCYWVFSLMLPCRDGYVSVQFAPGGELFKLIGGIYDDACAMEGAENGIAQETAALHRLARQRGFSTYESFITRAIGQEIAGHDRMTGMRADPRSPILMRMSEAAERGMQEQVALQRSFDAIQLIPSNMRIVASRLEPSGGPISAIAENYKASSLVIARRLDDFVGREDCLCESVVMSVARTMILLGGIRILGELLADGEGDAVWATERRLIEAMVQRMGLEVRDAIREAIDRAGRLNRASIEIRRHMLGLDTIRVLGRVECCRIPEAGGLAATIDQLDAFHAEIKSRLEAIMQTSEAVGSAMGDLLRTERREAG